MPLYAKTLTSKDKVQSTRASALIVGEKTPHFQGPQILVSNPAMAYTQVAELFTPPLVGYHGVSPDAVIHEKARIGRDVSIFPLVYISEGAVIGDHATLYPGVFVGERVRIGEGSVIYPNVSILHDCVVGNRTAAPVAVSGHQGPEVFYSRDVASREKRV